MRRHSIFSSAIEILGLSSRLVIATPAEMRLALVTLAVATSAVTKTDGAIRQAMAIKADGTRVAMHAVGIPESVH